MVNANKPIQYLRVEKGGLKTIESEIITETPVSLTINGEVWLTFMCTPVDLEAFAVGFLFNEGLIQNYGEVASVRVCPSGDNIDIWLHNPLMKPDLWRRTSGCTGGVTSVDTDSPEIAVRDPELSNSISITPQQINNLIGKLFESQTLYRKSGGVHTSALSDGHQIHIAAEDIGRHNTLDKLAGHTLLNNMNIDPRILLTTGRISSEMMQKAVRLRASVVISRTSPSSLSIQMADRWGITLIGYARRNRFNIYTHPQRILIEADVVPSFAPEGIE